MLELIVQTPLPCTQELLVRELGELGIHAGDILLVHSSLSSLGWVCGAEQTVVAALMERLGSSGTLVMPTHTPDNTDPANWRNPPVPESWWSVIRSSMPAFDPEMTPTKRLGRIPETFRKFPGVMRSYHPIGSFAAWGRHAAALTAPHSLEPMFGDSSPIGRLYDLDSKVLLLGVVYDSCTCLHLAEYRSAGNKRYIQEGTAMMVGGVRNWVNVVIQGLETDDFNEIGSAFEAKHAVHKRTVGNAQARVFALREIVDFAQNWMNLNRIG
jgi:aminoglycoside 3-N-acetyltransferase